MSFQSLHLCFMFALLPLLTLPRRVECVRIHLSEVQCARACEMIQNGQTQRQVAMTLGVSQSAIRNIWNRFQDTGRYSRRPGTGVWRSTNDRDDRYLYLLVRRNPFYSARKAHIEWRQACGVNVSIQTARNRLHDRGLNARQPHVVPDLTARHRRLRLQFWFVGSLTSLCHSNGHIETMPAREINPFTALTRIRSQFLRTQ